MEKHLKFIGCGNTGDLIHGMFAAKHICKKMGMKGSLYITDKFRHKDLFECGHFAFHLEKSIHDLKELMLNQEWLIDFDILPIDFNIEDYIYLSEWRRVSTPKPWTKIMTETFDFPIPDEYPWLDVPDPDDNTKGKVLIHSSTKRHNSQFPWDRILREIDKEILFVTSNENEFDDFKHKGNKVKPYFVETIYDMAKAINSCDLFIGNQSLLFAIATSLDKPRICELHDSSHIYYSGEHRYSDNLSWFLNNKLKHNSDNVKIKI